MAAWQSHEPPPDTRHTEQTVEKRAGVGTELINKNRKPEHQGSMHINEHHNQSSANVGVLSPE